VQVECEGNWYPATVTADDGVGSCTVKYDDASFEEEETVGYDRVKPEESAAELPADVPPPEAAPSADVPPQEEPSAGWVGKHVLVEYLTQWYGATITADDGETCSVAFDDEEHGTEDNVPYSRIDENAAPEPEAVEAFPSAEVAQVEEPAAESWVGKRVQVECEGNWYPATVTADDGVSSCTVKYDDVSFDDELVAYDRVKPEEEAAEAQI